MADANDSKVYTLTDVSKATKISMPTLQRYKKLYQDRIPSVGSGRTQRYPEEALDVFRELKKENMGKRGRPRKNAAADAKKPKVSKGKLAELAAAKSAPPTSDASGELLTLKEIEGRTKISYPTLLRYVKTSLKRIPHSGTGRKRRYPPEAVDVFKTLREESRRGRKAGRGGPRAASTPKAGGGASSAVASVPSSVVQELKELQKAHRELQRQVQRLERELHKPFKVVLKR
ncbi:MAG: helix-turn-helix domain-containing protein [Acidobacteriota bacterium]